MAADLPAQGAAPAPWWQRGVVYQVYPRSFADTDGDGVGDLEGVRRRLDHLEWLGIDAIWLSPIFRSPMADFGYDVSDYTDVDPVFGSLDDLDRLVADAHDRGIRVILDWVPNHTSDQHPWFVESRSSRDNPKRDWYVWRDGSASAGPPNDWSSAFVEPARWERDPTTRELRRVRAQTPGVEHRGTAWTFDETTGQWYLHLFLPEQPDLDWRTPEVESAMHDVLRFWLDRGIDGFRADVVHMIGKDVGAQLATIPQSDIGEGATVHAILRRIRTLLDGYHDDRMMVGEVFILDPTEMAKFYGDSDELHLSFNFAPLFTRWDARRWRERVIESERVVTPAVGWPTWVLSNHDVVRHADRYGSEGRARAAAVLLLTLRGTPFLYAGEELGLLDAVVPPDRVVDPGGRDGCRAPIPWTRDERHGWGDEAWLPFPPDASARSLEAQRDDPTSILHLYRRLLAARRASPALQVGELTVLDAPDGVLAWDRVAGGDHRRILVNFTEDHLAVAGLSGGWAIDVSTHDAFDGTLRPDEAVILRRP
jgi:alpha-glucosidase